MSDVIELLKRFMSLKVNGKTGTFNAINNSMSDFNKQTDLNKFIEDYNNGTNYIGLISFTDTRDKEINNPVQLFNDLTDIKAMGYKKTIGSYDGYEATAIIYSNTIAGLLDKTPCTQKTICVIDVGFKHFRIIPNPDYKEIIRLV